MGANVTSRQTRPWIPQKKSEAYASQLPSAAECKKVFCEYIGVLVWLVVLGVERGRQHFRLPDTSATVAGKTFGVCETYVPYAINLSNIILFIYLYV